VLEFTTLKFKDDSGLIYPAATLRPETVFGVTNMWLNQNVEYVIAKVGGEKWVVTPQALAKLKFQKEGVEEAGKVSGRSLIGKTSLSRSQAPGCPYFPVRSWTRTLRRGVVMSVPAHAPYDWAALVGCAEGRTPAGDGVRASPRLPSRPSRRSRSSTPRNASRNTPPATYAGRWASPPRTRNNCWTMRRGSFTRTSSIRPAKGQLRQVFGASGQPDQGHPARRLPARRTCRRDLRVLRARRVPLRPPGRHQEDTQAVVHTVFRPRPYREGARNTSRP